MAAFATKTIMDNKQNAEEKKPLAVEGEEAKKPEEAKAEPEKKADEPQEPLKKELEEIKDKKEGRTRKEKLVFKKKLIDKQLKNEFPEDYDIEPESDDDKPVTVGMLKEIKIQDAQKTALQLADEIEDEAEKELVKYHLNNSINSTGNGKKDLKLARAIVNSLKNAQIAEEAGRKGSPSSGFGGPGSSNKYEKPFEPTKEEERFMRPPYNLTKEQILEARNKEAEKDEKK
jgi:hypothetical protein